MAPGPRQVRQGHEDDLLGAGRKRSAGRDRLSEDAAEIIVWKPSTKAKTRAAPGALSQPAIAGRFQRLPVQRANVPHAANMACPQQPRQMFPIARSTAASSGVGLTMASGSEGTSADVG